MEIITRLTVVSNPTRIFEIGTEINGREVIEICWIGSEYQVLDEDGYKIATIESAPVILDYQKIAVDDEKGDPR